MTERTVLNGERSGTVRVPSSKSEAERYIIAGALTEGTTKVRFSGLSDDLNAALDCIRALGAEVAAEQTGDGVTAFIGTIPGVCRKTAAPVLLPCRESAAVLRFLIPLAGAFGIPAVFLREGKLRERPIRPYLNELARHGMVFSDSGDALKAEERLQAGSFELPGNVSSQFVSGLLIALPLAERESTLKVDGPVESEGYIRMTERVLREAGIVFERKLSGSALRYRIPGGQRYRLPAENQAGGDWSGAAFFLAMGALSGQGVRVEGLARDSDQGDRAVLDILRKFGAKVSEDECGVTVQRGTLKGCRIHAAGIPDLIPPLAVLAGLAAGETVIDHAGRLRFKESDRIRTVSGLINGLGGQCLEEPEGLRIFGVPAYKGGRVITEGDHRIAMAAAVAAAGSLGPVVIEGADAVGKSFPEFFDKLESLSEKA